jgi:hypothetical protein
VRCGGRQLKLECYESTFGTCKEEVWKQRGVFLLCGETAFDGRALVDIEGGSGRGEGRTIRKAPVHQENALPADALRVGVGRQASSSVLPLSFFFYFVV